MKQTHENCRQAVIAVWLAAAKTKPRTVAVVIGVALAAWLAGTAATRHQQHPDFLVGVWKMAPEPSPVADSSIYLVLQPRGDWFVSVSDSKPVIKPREGTW